MSTVYYHYINKKFSLKKRSGGTLAPQKKWRKLGFRHFFFRANLEDESGGIWAQNMKEVGAEMILTKKSGARINVHLDPHISVHLLPITGA